MPSVQRVCDHCHTPMAQPVCVVEWCVIFVTGLPLTARICEQEGRLQWSVLQRWCADRTETTISIPTHPFPVCPPPRGSKHTEIEHLDGPFQQPNCCRTATSLANEKGNARESSTLRFRHIPPPGKNHPRGPPTGSLLWRRTSTHCCCAGGRGHDPTMRPKEARNVQVGPPGCNRSELNGTGLW